MSGENWLVLLRRAVRVAGSLEKVGARIGYGKSTISQVLNNKYGSSTEDIAAKVLEVYGGETMAKETIPDGYKRNAVGHLVPVETIKDVDLARDEFVLETIKKANVIATLVADFKVTLAGDVQAWLDLAAEKYDAQLGSMRGNVTLTSFGGKYQLLRAVSDQFDFDEALQAAKALIDECLRDWTRGGDPRVRALIDDAFQVDKKGRINAKRILGLRKLKIDDPKWLKAMEAINDSLTVVGSRTYFRFYERDERGNYQQIQLDFSGV